MHRTLTRQKRDGGTEVQEQDKAARNFSIIDLAELDGVNLDLVTTTWIGGKIQDRKPVAFAMLWNYERYDNEEHPVVALLLADSHRCVMLQTKKTGHWLPRLVQELLQDQMVLKICASWTKRHKEKLAYCFSLELRNFTVLFSLAMAKGINKSSLDELTDHMQLPRRRLLVEEGMDSSSDWEAQELTRDQLQHVQEFPHLLYQLWEKLNPLPEVEQKIATGILGVKDGWEAQGIRRRHDGLYCDLCEAGPVGSTEQMEAHVQGKRHQRKARPPDSVEAKLALSAELLAEGIEVSDFCSSESFGLYFCRACGVGPFHDLTSVQTHIDGGKHKKVCGKPKPIRESKVELSAADLLRRHYGFEIKNSVRPKRDVTAGELLRKSFEDAFPDFPKKAALETRGGRLLRVS